MNLSEVCQRYTFDTQLMYCGFRSLPHCCSFVTVLCNQAGLVVDMEPKIPCCMVLGDAGDQPGASSILEKLLTELYHYPCFCLFLFALLSRVLPYSPRIALSLKPSFLSVSCILREWQVCTTVPEIMSFPPYIQIFPFSFTKLKMFTSTLLDSRGIVLY